MRPLLYLSCLLLALPGTGLAAAFLILGSAIAAHTFLGFLGVLLDLFLWLVPWGLLALAAVFLVLVLAGLTGRFRWLASTLVAALAIASSVIVLAFTASHDGFSAEQIWFFVPAALSATGCLWLALTEWPRRKPAPDAAAPARLDGSR